MIWPLRKNPASPEAVQAVYNAIVAQSRQEVLYAECGVPDTATGRFDMISLHICLLSYRLSGEARDFAQALFDLFFRDMDRSLREMGIGDLSVPKRIQKMGGAFYGLFGKLAGPVRERDADAVAEVLNRNFFEPENKQAAARLAHYVLALAGSLAAQPAGNIVSGSVELGVKP